MVSVFGKEKKWLRFVFPSPSVQQLEKIFFQSVCWGIISDFLGGLSSSMAGCSAIEILKGDLLMGLGEFGREKDTAVEDSMEKW